MPTAVTFHKRVPQGSRGSLAELMARQAEAARASTSAQDIQTPTIMQGLGKLGQIGAGVFNERRAAKAEGASREALAKLIAGVGEGGATQQQVADMGLYDQDLAEQYRQEAVAARVRADELARKEADYKRDIGRQDFEWDRTQQDQAADEARQAAAAARVTEGERKYQDEDQIADEARQAAAAAKVTAGERKYQDEDQIADEARQAAAAAGVEANKRDYEGGIRIQTRNQKLADDRTQFLREQAEHERTLREGQVAGLSPEQKAALNLPPDQDYLGTAAGTDITVLDKPKTKMSRPATPEERRAYNVPEGQGLEMNSEDGVNWSPQGVGGAVPAPTPIASEVAARLGLMTPFLEAFPDVLAEVNKGSVTGPVDYPVTSTLGRGKGGEIVGTIRAGADALLRNLTGAGMPLLEAEKYVTRYEPGISDDAATLARKVTQLRTHMLSVREAATQGRRWEEMVDPAFLADRAPEAPAAEAPAAPAPKRLEDMSDAELAAEEERLKRGGR